MRLRDSLVLSAVLAFVIPIIVYLTALAFYRKWRQYHRQNSFSIRGLDPPPGTADQWPPALASPLESSSDERSHHILDIDDAMVIRRATMPRRKGDNSSSTSSAEGSIGKLTSAELDTDVRQRDSGNGSALMRLSSQPEDLAPATASRKA